MIQIFAYGVPPVATAGVYFFGFTPEDRKKISLHSVLICLGCFWLAAALLVFWGAFIGINWPQFKLYSLDDVLLNTIVPVGVVGLALTAISGAFNPSFMFRSYPKPIASFLGSATVAMLIPLAAYADSATGNHLGLAYAYTLVASLPWVDLGFMHFESATHVQLAYAVTASTGILLLPVMLGAFGIMVRGVLGRFAWLSDYWCTAMKWLIILQFLAYVILAGNSLEMHILRALFGN